MELEALDDLYRDIILDHYKHPRHSKNLEDPDIAAEGNNPFCGDEITLQLKLSDGHISDIGFHGRGCSISQASGSMLASILEGKTLEEALELVSIFGRMMKGQEPSAEEKERLGELESLSGVKQFPIRIKCALLGWSILEDGIKEYRAKEN